MARVRKNSSERWVNTSLLLQPNGSDLVYGLGSKFFRDAGGMEDDERVSDRPADLPASLTQFQILKIYRDEFEEWGRQNLGRWTDQLDEGRQGYVIGWLSELVLAVFPELEGTI